MKKKFIFFYLIVTIIIGLSILFTSFSYGIPGDIGKVIIDGSDFTSIVKLIQSGGNLFFFVFNFIISFFLYTVIFIAIMIIINIFILKWSTITLKTETLDSIDALFLSLYMWILKIDLIFMGCFIGISLILPNFIFRLIVLFIIFVLWFMVSSLFLYVKKCNIQKRLRNDRV